MVEHHDGRIEILNWANMAHAKTVPTSLTPIVGAR